MNILTIDFDIIMYPSIDLYNDSDLTVDEFLNKFDFIGTLNADLELYKRLTNLLLSYNSHQINFIYDHHDIVDEIKDIDGKINLYNIDFHHDIGYGDINANIPLKENEYHEGNWVKYLWDIDKINTYTWYKTYNSVNPDRDLEKFLTDKHYIESIDNSEFKDLKIDELYICLSSPWVPEYYTYLYDLWRDLTNIR